MIKIRIFSSLIPAKAGISRSHKDSQLNGNDTVGLGNESTKAEISILKHLFFVMLFLVEPSFSEASSNKTSAPTEKPSPEKQALEKGLTNQEKKDIESILAEIAKKSPAVQSDALRVWNNFKKGKSDPNHTYRQWARTLILELRNTKNWVFDSEKKVGAVFVYLFNEKKISSDAVFVLTHDVWGFLLYTHGVPDAPSKENTPKEEDKQHSSSSPPFQPKKQGSDV